MTRRPAFERRALFGMGAAAALLAVSGISAAGMARQGGRLRMAVSGGKRSDTWRSGDGLFMQVARVGLVFDTLTQVAADSTLRGDLATGWRSADGGRTWHFDLRRNVLFHDGSVLTAEDVTLALTPAFGPEDRLTILGDAELAISLAHPDPGLPFRLSGAAFAIQKQNAPEAGIGTGPYRVQEFVPGQRLVAARVSGHHGEGTSGWFDSVELVSISDAMVRLQAFDEHLVDAVDLPAQTTAAPSRDHVMLRTQDGGLQAISRSLATGMRQGRQLPFDDLRAPRRWWFA